MVVRGSSAPRPLAGSRSGWGKRRQAWSVGVKGLTPNGRRTGAEVACQLKLRWATGRSWAGGPAPLRSLARTAVAHRSQSRGAARGRHRPSRRVKRGVAGGLGSRARSAPLAVFAILTFPTQGCRSEEGGSGHRQLRAHGACSFCTASAWLRGGGTGASSARPLPRRREDNAEDTQEIALCPPAPRLPSWSWHPQEHSNCLLSEGMNECMCMHAREDLWSTTREALVVSRTLRHLPRVRRSRWEGGEGQIQGGCK